MKQTGVPSLAELRAEVREARSERVLRRMASELGGDPRAGGRALAELCARRCAELRAERRRLSRLFALRRRLLRQGHRHVAGVDEVGVGPLAGPVVAAAVVLPARVDLPGLDDSKRLKASERQRLSAQVRQQALAVSLGEVWPEEIDRINIYQASLEAMRLAVAGLAVRPDHILVDARVIPRTPVEQTRIVHGDALDGSIAAASIVAKVYRDALMADLEADYPGYGFARHKGYGTPEHLERLRRIGPSPVHRRSFGPVARFSGLRSP